MKKIFYRFWFLTFGITLLSSCAGSLKNEPIKTIKDQTEGFHKKIEDTLSKKYISKNYQSLSFGQLKVYKPDAFELLDSLYGVKQSYLNNNDLRGLRRSGVEDLIPGFRAKATQEVDEVQYEIEHIYQISTKDSLIIHHSFFLFDYKDSLLHITPFYDFKIDKKHKDFYYAYKFDYHFVTSRSLYLSEKEWEFIRFFKNREIQLIGSEELQAFMNHTMNVMEAARKTSTIDFRNVSRQLVFNYFKSLGKDITIEKVGQLMALENNGNVIGYEFDVEWIDETFAPIKKSTSITFSPYLEIESVETNTESRN
jgi:hypothetical protein